MKTDKRSISLSNLIRIEAFLTDSGIEPLDYLSGYLKGRAPAPIIWNDQIYLDTSDVASWRGELRASARMAQIKAMESAHG